MTELRIDFDSFQGWLEWSIRNQMSFDHWREAVVASVKYRGLMEPITGRVHPGSAVKVDVANLRESVSAEEMNSRKRACLAVLDGERMRLVPNRRQRPRILGTEAVTRVALALRGRFPYYLGTEYLPTEGEQVAHFPIRHLDLLDIDLPDGSFDMFHSADVLEHVPDVMAALREIARVLDHGGVAVSTFPFDPGRLETLVKAELVDGEVRLRAPPEYHGNPARPAEGSLVYSLPGWDVLDACREAGFRDAKMTFVVSSGFGVVAHGTAPGVFVLVATKASAGRQNILYDGPHLSKVAGLLALPRSGTTLLTSVLGVHSRIRGVYEPWNSNKQRQLTATVPLDDFFRQFPTDMKGKDVLLVKETATEVKYIDQVAALLSSVPQPIGQDLIVLFRNPLHVFFSEIEARREWWGEDGLAPTIEVFDKWSDRTTAGLKRILQFGAQFNAIVVSYEALVARKSETVEKLMDMLGLDIEAKQLEFEKHVRTQEVRGDVGLSRSPVPISPSSIKKRESEVQGFLEILANSDRYGGWIRLGSAMAALSGLSPIRFLAEQGRDHLNTIRDVVGLPPIRG